MISRSSTGNDRTKKSAVCKDGRFFLFSAQHGSAARADAADEAVVRNEPAVRVRDGHLAGGDAPADGALARERDGLPQLGQPSDSACVSKIASAKPRQPKSEASSGRLSSSSQWGQALPSMMEPAERPANCFPSTSSSRSSARTEADSARMPSSTSPPERKITSLARRMRAASRSSAPRPASGASVTEAAPALRKAGSNQPRKRRLSPLAVPM